MPQFLSVAVVPPEPDNRNLEVQVDVKLTYKGGALLVIDAELTLGVFVPLTVHMHELKGTVRIYLLHGFR